MTTSTLTIAAEQAGATTRLLLPGATDLAAHGRRHGAVAYRGGPGALIELLEAAGLTGRGGAAFPTWRKVASAAAAMTGGGAPARRGAVVIANGAEGEPASSKDAVLLSTTPHLVLDGAQLAAEAVGATRIAVYVKAGAATTAVVRALVERAGTGRDRVPMELVEAPTGFVSGEESAAVAAVEGRPALPRTKRRLISECGVEGRPTLVQNVETLAHVALIARRGAAWFRAAGTASEPGTFLATLGGAVVRPGVAEASYGVLLADLLALAGGPSRPPGAVLVGGYHGVWVPASALATTPMSRAGLAPFGGTPGAGIVWTLPADQCPLAAAASIVGYLAAQSARQCGPCLFGLPALAAELALLADPRAAAGLAEPSGRLGGLARLVTGRGACRHPDGTARLVRSTMTTFADEVAAHRRGHCLEGSR